MLCLCCKKAASSGLVRSFLSFLLVLLACWPDSSHHGGTDSGGTDVIPGSLKHNCFKQ